MPLPLEKDSILPAMKTNRIAWTKWGMAENPVGFQVSLPFNGRNLLGDVISYRVDEKGSVRLRVNHFNGEQWELEPIATVVEVIGRP